MAITPIDAKKAARVLAREMFVEVKDTAVLNLDELMALIQSIDDFMGMNPNNPALSVGQSMRMNIVDLFPANAKTGLTTAQQVHAIKVWAMVDSGAI